MNIAVVTGASSGMGEYFSLMIPDYFKNIDEIWLIARRKKKLTEISKYISIPCRILNGDLLDDSFYVKLSEELNDKSINVGLLVNCAGFGKNGTFESIAAKNAHIQSDMVRLNCCSVIRMCEAILSHMNKDSRIINVASGSAFCPQPGFAVYAATKSFVLSYSRALKMELKDRHIYVTAVCPGPVDTEFFDTAGQISSPVKKLVMARPEKVVKKALNDSLKKKELSVYGISIKLSHIASKIFPQKLIMRFF